MKTLFTIILVVSSLCASASTYTETMKTSIDKIFKAKSVSELDQIAGLFYRIGEKEQNEWLPYYYAAYAYTHATFFIQDADSTDAVLDKAQAVMDQLIRKKDDESEVYVLQALIYSMRITSASRGFKYSSLSAEALAKAEGLNAANPRIHYCRGNNVIHTPKMFGGGSAKALAHFKRADELFTSNRVENALLPQWGEKHNREMLEKCQSEQ